MRELLEGRISPEYLDALERVSVVLERLNYTDHVDAITALEGSASLLDPETYGTHVQGILGSATDAVLDKFDITIDAQMPLNLVYFLLLTLAEFKKAEDAELLQDILNTAGDTTEALAEILALRTPHDETVWMPWILTASRDLIEKMIEEATDADIDPIEQSQLPAVRVRELLVSDPDSIVSVAVESCIPLGVDVDVLRGHYRQRLNVGLESTGAGNVYVDQLVKDLVGLHVYSGTPTEHIAEEVRVELDAYLIDLDEIQRGRKTLDAYMRSNKC